MGRSRTGESVRVRSPTEECVQGAEGGVVFGMVIELSALYVIALILATIVCLATTFLGTIQVLYISVYITQSDRRLFILYLASTAPFVSMLSLIAMYMPRIWFLSHLLSFLYFSVALWIIICLLMQIFHGHHSLVSKLSEHLQHIEVATPPFCCVFPCLPKVQLESKKVRICELMVVQAPCVRLLATFLSLVIYFEYQEKAFVILKVLDFATLPSLLAGIYGTHILVTTVSRLDELISYRYVVVFRILDLFFMFFGLQQPVFDFLARYGVFGCGTVLPAIETSFFWKNLLTVIESFFVTLISSILLQPSKSSFFDKHPSCRSMTSRNSHTVDTNETST
ncbi:Organic solute transporter alpha-like protein 2 [Parelaphostrongylus tenuis]|uniref:Organic solute transporter alpha-like protein 2 n=1 Tax=Parelaphostrongylus tenuis TaxID=148309 RepID=A0AAD5MVF1_PARTN|nr:Organic solute transporter alpha-like protein 2 [Parelaphostrongylus tenuis]